MRAEALRRASVSFAGIRAIRFYTIDITSNILKILGLIQEQKHED